MATSAIFTQRLLASSFCSKIVWNRDSFRLNQPGFLEEYNLNAKHLPAGLYYLVVQQAGKVVHRDRVVFQP